MVVARLTAGSLDRDRIPYRIKIIDDPDRSAKSSGPYDIVLVLEDDCHGYEIPAGAEEPTVTSEDGTTTLVWEKHGYGESVDIVIVCQDAKCTDPIESHLNYNRGGTKVVGSEDSHVPCAEFEPEGEPRPEFSDQFALELAERLQRAFERGFRLGLQTGVRLKRPRKRGKRWREDD